ncbi:D-3-phosphoglycerate dehydrogenase [Mesonia hippocampi]|uniref:D-3-phosphoglycerate dehydrogenase n=1 Tax=Mesonia hippocampi TaxID=1628250 RepID=A0A840EYS7_9FLAO|nr:D-2-hydroxyacid dehydrogenase [Mesonia hippocampi]MBB4119194.1 D-3-phosphoglycerate dehydrogenase [Mesonia hippocampi]
MNILANDGISESGIKKLSQKGFNVDTTKVAQNQLINYINNKQIEVLLVRSATQVNKALIDACPQLKIIGRAGVGLDNIDVATAEKKGIKIINTPTASSRSVAELAFAHILGGSRFLHQTNRDMPLDGDMRFKELKKLSTGNELKGKTLGIIGLGSIGKELAKLGIGFGMNVIAHTITDKPNEKIRLDFFDGQYLEVNIPLQTKENLLKQADFISVHVPAQKNYLIGEEEFNYIKPGAAIINTARGGVIDEVALVNALENKKIKFAGLDVFEKEPQPEVQLLMQPEMSLSPHIGGATHEAQERIGEILAEQIIKIYNV